jgi:hypothetical protein
MQGHSHSIALVVPRELPFAFPKQPPAVEASDFQQQQGLHVSPTVTALLAHSHSIPCGIGMQTNPHIKRINCDRRAFTLNI